MALLTEFVSIQHFFYVQDYRDYLAILRKLVLLDTFAVSVTHVRRNNLYDKSASRLTANFFDIHIVKLFYTIK